MRIRQMIDGRPLLPPPGSSDPWRDAARGVGECRDLSESADALGLEASSTRAALRFLFLVSPPTASCSVLGFFCALFALPSAGTTGTSSPTASWPPRPESSHCFDEACECAAGDEAAELSVERPRFLRPLGGRSFSLVWEPRRDCGGLPGRHHRSISALDSRTSSTQHGSFTPS